MSYKDSDRPSSEPLPAITNNKRTNLFALNEKKKKDINLHRKKFKKQTQEANKSEEVGRGHVIVFAFAKKARYNKTIVTHSLRNQR
jgi:hypothetical protein